MRNITTCDCGGILEHRVDTESLESTLICTQCGKIYDTMPIHDRLAMSLKLITGMLDGEKPN